MGEGEGGQENGLAILCSDVMLHNLNHLQSRSRAKTHLM